MDIFNNITKVNDSNQKYIWFVEYKNGNIFKEYNDIINNSFYDIEQEKAKYFGLLNKIGIEYKFEKDSGIFFIDEIKLKFNIFDNENNEFKQSKEKDLITFKHAYTDMNLKTKRMETIIDAFYLGYKTKYTYNDIEIDAKIIFNFSINGNISCGVKLSGYDDNLKINILIDKDIFVEKDIVFDNNRTFLFETKIN